MVSAALAEQAKKAQGSGTQVTAAACQSLLLALADILDAAAADLRDAELALSAERADDQPVRAARDGAAAEIADLLALLRSTVDNHLGPAAVAIYGLQGDVTRVPAKLLGRAQNVVQLLGQHPASVANAFGSTFDTKSAAQTLAAKVAVLEGHIKDDNREVRELETALSRRDRAAAAWSDAYQGTATALEGLYRQAGYKDLSEKVRPTQRKLRGEDEGPEIEETPPAAAPAEG